MQSELANGVLVPYGIENCKELIQKVYTQIYSELVNSVDNAPYESKDNRSYVILVSASERIRLLVVKLMVLLKWTRNLDIIERCQRFIFYDNNNVQQLTNTTNILFGMIGRMHISLQPFFPLNSALAILTLGEYPFIPPVCDSKAPFVSKISMEQGKKVTNRILKTRILTELIPSYVSSIHVREQVIVCEERNFFAVQFTNTKPTLDSTMTVTELRIYNNNNTRMTVFPYFSSEQLSRIIDTLNQVIRDDTQLATVIEKIYSILYFTITKQILFVLHLQLNALSLPQKTTYGLSDFSYNIDTDTLSFSFWKKMPSKRGIGEIEENQIIITRKEDPVTHLMGLVGTCNDYTFSVDLIQYRVFDIILRCIQYRQHSLLTMVKEYLERELANTHYSVQEDRIHDWIHEISIHIHSTPVSLLLSIHSFTGEFELTLSDPSILHWCEPLILELKTLIQARYPLIDKLDQFYIYCVLYQIAHNYMQTSPDYRFVYSTYEDVPCLYLPCLFTKDLPNTNTQYKLLIRLLQNTSLCRIASCASIPQLSTPSLLQGKAAYHSINNTMSGLNEYSPTEEVGFDIDGEAMHSESSEAEEDAIDPWMIDVIGVRQTRIVRGGEKVELLESVHKKVVCSPTSIHESREEVNYAIDKLLPRLRYESLVSTVNVLKQYNLLSQEKGDRDRRIDQIVCNNIKLTLKVEDDMEIRVLQEANELQLFNKVVTRRGCYQHIKIKDKQAEFTLVPNASPMHFRSILDSYSKTLIFYNSLLQSYRSFQVPFTSSLEMHVSSLFTVVLLYHFPHDGNFHSITITFPPWNALNVLFDLDIPAVNSHIKRYTTVCLHGKKPFDCRTILIGIAAQYVYMCVWKELRNQGVLKESGSVLLFSIGISRMELRIRFKEQVSFYLVLSLDGVRIEPKDEVSRQFLVSIGMDSSSVMQNYDRIHLYISDLVSKRRM